MTKIGLYGGSFNPIGLHHTKIMQEIIKLGIVDEIWLMPCFMKDFKVLESCSHRLAMCKIAVANLNDDRIKVYNYEIANKLQGTTYNIIKQFYKDHDANNIYYFIIGSDNAINISRWNDWEKVLDMISFIVVPRITYDIEDDAWCLHQPHIYLKKLVMENYSSTMIRAQLEKYKTTDLIDKNVLEYILTHNLYCD